MAIRKEALETWKLGKRLGLNSEEDDEPWINKLEHLIDEEETNQKKEEETKKGGKQQVQ